ncbi:MAG: N-acetyltransferase [Melioribacteraceae bacterium]|nr:N-acetyltransferase [Melioribacteraceae bacterium]
MSVSLKEVTADRDLKRFIDFQYKLYKNNYYWVPPLKKEEIFLLNRDKNPAFDFCETKYWLAYKDEKIVGRIAGIINYKFNEKFDKKIMRFGWIDFIDDAEVCSTLLSAVENWAKEKGMSEVHGPLGFTDMDGEGTLIEGFEEMSLLGAIYNYPYYPKLIEQNGYTKDIDWVEFQVTMTSDPVPEKISRISEIALKRNKLHVLRVKKSKELLPYAREMFYLINDAYKDLYGFVELSDKQIDMYVKQYFGFIKPEYLPIVLNEKNEMVAFGITMPSLSKAFRKANGNLFPFGFIHILKAMKNNPGLDLYLTAVRPDMQDKGVNAVLMNEINKLIIDKKITTVETNRELEDNTKVQAQWRFFEHRQHKRRRCYKKEI